MHNLLFFFILTGMRHFEQNYTIIQARAVLENTILEDARISVRNGIICAISADNSQKIDENFPVFNAHKSITGPGLIDMHLHGCGGADTASGNLENNLVHMANFLCERGITSFQPAFVMDMDNVRQAQAALQNKPALSARIAGIYVEGPFLCPEKKGGLSAESLRPFSQNYAQEIASLSFTVDGIKKPLVKTMVIAPELDGAQELENILDDAGITPAWGHSNAFFADIKNRKTRHITHLFNAMNGIDHRNPGLALLPFTQHGKNTTFEIICDTVHVHPAILELIFNSPAAHNACIISDCMSSGGSSAGESVYLNRLVTCDGRVSRYKDNGVLIGSAMLIADTAQELFSAGLIDEKLFFQAAAKNPAHILGMTDRGVLAVGKKADIILCDSTMHITDVFSS